MVTLANVEPPHRSEADIREAFKVGKGVFLAVFLLILTIAPAALPLTPNHQTFPLTPNHQTADSDNNGTLSKTEFLALYTSLIKDRVTTSPLVLAEALFGLIDVDRNGRIEGGELKVSSLRICRG